jgi:hypothetical protein
MIEKLCKAQDNMIHMAASHLPLNKEEGWELIQAGRLCLRALRCRRRAFIIPASQIGQLNHETAQGARVRTPDIISDGFYRERY